MRKTFMVSVAVAALFAATGFAAAQGANPSATKGAESPAAASPKGDTAAPAHAPAAKGEAAAPGAAKHAQDKGEASGAGAHGKPDAKTTGEMKPDSSTKASDSTAPAAHSKDMKNPTAETKSPADGKTAAETKTDSKSKASDSTAPTTNSKDMKNPTAETKSPTAETKSPTAETKSPTAETKSPTAEGKTTGNAATSATAAPPAEKQTQIVSVIRQEKVEEVTNVNFSISIGTAVPSHVHYHPLPARIVEIYPEWRGYDFIRVGARYIILRPHTREIVYIIEG